MNYDNSFLIHSIKFNSMKTDETSVRYNVYYVTSSYIAELVSNVKKPFQINQVDYYSDSSSYIILQEYWIEFESAEDKLYEMLKFQFKNV